ncbi:MAG: GNAT family N-acetyltransferase [Mollicutes bacterium]|nr:GNAT family N-acetyltransferase [Mollicutes bacterium]
MIRDIIKEDIKYIYKLVDSFDNNFKQIYNLEGYINKKDYILKCYAINKQIVGFIIGILIDKEYDLEYVFVDSLFRKKGIATKLINSIVEDKKISRIVLEVSDNNKKAINLYKKLGFSVINKREKYYKDGSNALLMELII